MTPQSSPYQEPAQHEIAAYAHSIWESEGRPEGREISHWFQAKTHLIAARKLEAGMIRPRGRKTRADNAKQGSASRDALGKAGEAHPAGNVSRKRQERALTQSAK